MSALKENSIPSSDEEIEDISSSRFKSGHKSQLKTKKKNQMFPCLYSTENNTADFENDSLQKKKVNCKDRELSCEKQFFNSLNTYRDDSCTAPGENKQTKKDVVPRNTESRKNEEKSRAMERLKLKREKKKAAYSFTYSDSDSDFDIPLIESLQSKKKIYENVLDTSKELFSSDSESDLEFYACLNKKEKKDDKDEDNIKVKQQKIAMNKDTVKFSEESDDDLIPFKNIARESRADETPETVTGNCKSARGENTYIVRKSLGITNNISQDSKLASREFAGLSGDSSSDIDDEELDDLVKLGTGKSNSESDTNKLVFDADNSSLIHSLSTDQKKDSKKLNLEILDSVLFSDLPGSWYKDGVGNEMKYPRKRSSKGRSNNISSALTVGLPKPKKAKLSLKSNILPLDIDHNSDMGNYIDGGDHHFEFDRSSDDLPSIIINRSDKSEINRNCNDSPMDTSVRLRNEEGGITEFDGDALANSFENQGMNSLPSQFSPSLDTSTKRGSTTSSNEKFNVKRQNSKSAGNSLINNTYVVSIDNKKAGKLKLRVNSSSAGRKHSPSVNDVTYTVGSRASTHMGSDNRQGKKHENYVLRSNSSINKSEKHSTADVRICDKFIKERNKSNFRSLDHGGINFQSDNDIEAMDITEENSNEYRYKTELNGQVKCLNSSVNLSSDSINIEVDVDTKIAAERLSVSERNSNLLGKSCAELNNAGIMNPNFKSSFRSALSVYEESQNGNGSGGNLDNNAVSEIKRSFACTDSHHSEASNPSSSNKDNSSEIPTPSITPTESTSKNLQSVKPRNFYNRKTHQQNSSETGDLNPTNFQHPNTLSEIRSNSNGSSINGVSLSVSVMGSDDTLSRTSLDLRRTSTPVEFGSVRSSRSTLRQGLDQDYVMAAASSSQSRQSDLPMVFADEMSVQNEILVLDDDDDDVQEGEMPEIVRVLPPSPRQASHHYHHSTTRGSGNRSPKSSRNRITSSTTSVPTPGGAAALQAVGQMESDEALARRLQEEMDHEFAQHVAQNMQTPTGERVAPRAGESDRMLARIGFMSEYEWNVHRAVFLGQDVPTPPAEESGKDLHEILDPEVLEYLENHPSASGRRPTNNQQSSANNAHVSGRTSSSSGNGRRSATSRGRTTRSSAQTNFERELQREFSGIDSLTDEIDNNYDIANIRNIIDVVDNNARRDGTYFPGLGANELSPLSMVLARQQQRPSRYRNTRRTRGAARGLPEGFAPMLGPLPMYMPGSNIQNETLTDDYETLLALGERIGDVRQRGLTATQLNRLPTKTFKTESHLNESRLPECNVCCCEYEQGDKQRLLPCFHTYHVACIDKWLKTSATCPICRADVKVD